MYHSRGFTYEAHHDFEHLLNAAERAAFEQEAIDSRAVAAADKLLKRTLVPPDSKCLAIVPYSSGDTHSCYSLVQWYQRPDTSPLDCTSTAMGVSCDRPLSVASLDAAMPAFTRKTVEEKAGAWKAMIDTPITEDDLPTDFGKVEYRKMCGAYCKQTLQRHSLKVAEQVEKSCNI